MDISWVSLFKISLLIVFGITLTYIYNKYLLNHLLKTLYAIIILTNKGEHSGQEGRTQKDKT